MGFKQPNRKPVKDPRYQTEGNIFVGIDFPVTGSQGDQYFVSMHEKGFSCVCTGFTMHGKCKHIKLIVDRLTSDHKRFKFSYN